MKMVFDEGKERWVEIKVNPNLDQDKTSQLWELLDQFLDVFTWHRGKLGCCKFGERVVDNQGFLPCKTMPRRLSFWEEAKVKKQIDALMALGKMKPSSYQYACKVTLLAKKDGSHQFYGDYKPSNLQTRRDTFPMPLVENVWTQLSKT
jgi:hypothetical protein